MSVLLRTRAFEAPAADSMTGRVKNKLVISFRFCRMFDGCVPLEVRWVDAKLAFDYDKEVLFVDVQVGEFGPFSCRND